MTLTHALCRVHPMSLEKQSLPAVWNAVMNGEPVADIAAALEAVRAIAQVRAHGPHLELSACVQTQAVNVTSSAVALPGALCRPDLVVPSSA